ncbi:MAG: ABC transporter permease [Burkholderiaceae bacterium]
MGESATWMTLLAWGPEGWGDELLLGAWLTVQLALVSLAAGLFFGLLLTSAAVSAWPPLRWLANAYMIFMRGVPEFLVLLLVFFGSEQILNGLLQMLGHPGGVTVPKFAAACMGLSMIFAAYACEVLRGAYQAVPSGQLEAARAVGMSGWQTLRRIRVPQMWRFAIPGLANLWMVMLKDTSLAAVIALDELLRVAKVAGETTRLPLLFFVVAGLIYLVLTALSDFGRQRLEARARRGFA